MTASTQANPSLGSFTAGYDPVAHTTGVALRVANIQTDTSVTPNVTYGDLGVDVTVSISPTANQRVNAQSGDFVAGSVVDLATLLTLSGTPTDANTVNSFMGRLTKVRDLLSAFGLDNTDRQKVSLYGKNAANADTTVLVDASGRVITSDQVRAAILSGTAFSVSTGMVAAVASQAGQWFVTSGNTKNILITSVRITYTNANQYGQFMYLTASDAVITGAGTTSVSTALNLKGGGSAPASTWSMNYNAAASATGTALDFFGISLSTSVELIPTGSGVYIPSATAGGIAAYCNTTAAGKWAMTVKWVEF